MTVSATGTYGSAQTITATLGQAGSIDFKVGGTSITGCSAVSSSGTTTATCSWTPTAVNSSTSITATLTPTSSSYSSVTSSASTVNVGKAALTVTPDAKSVNFGDSVPTYTFTVTGFKFSETSSTAASYVAPTCTSSYTSSTPVSSSPLTISCSGGSATNYSFTTSATANLTISAINQSALSISTTSGTHGTNLSLATSGGSGSGAVTYSNSPGTTTCSISGSTLTANGAGTCLITATKAGDGNYNSISSSQTTVTFAVGYRNITTSADSHSTITATGNAVYGADKEITFAPATGYSITGITVDGSALDNSSTPTLTAAVTAGSYTFASVSTTHTISVSTTINSYTITTSGDSHITITATSSVNYGSNKTVSFNVASGFTITSITIDSIALTGSDLSTAISNGSYTFTSVNANRSIAVYSENTTYVVTYNAGTNGVVSPSTATYTVGGSGVTLPTPTRTSFHFVGWYTSASGGSKIGDNGDAYSPTSAVTIYAQWVQNSLYGIDSGTLSDLGTVSASSGSNRHISADTADSSIDVLVPAGALPNGTTVSAKLVDDLTRAQTLIGNENDYLLSFVISWLTPSGTVPNTAAGKPLSITITSALIKTGASIYSIIDGVVTAIGRATSNGSAVVTMESDPEIVIAATAPESPTSVSATTDDTKSVVTWSAPTIDGGSTITGYTVTASNGQTCTTTGARTCTITGLTNGSTYTFTVKATNAVGTSSDSTPSSSVTPAVAAPAGGGGGGAGSAPVTPVTPVTPIVPVTPEVPTTPTTPNTPTAPKLPVDKPILNTNEGKIDTTKVSDGIVVVNGKVTEAVVKIETTSAVINAPTGTTLSITAVETKLIEQLPSVPENTLVLTQGEQSSVTGGNFKPESTVVVWVFSTPRKIGTLKVDSDGSFLQNLVIPKNLKPGRHTLQINGVTETNQVISNNLPIFVLAKKNVKTTNGKSPVEAGTEDIASNLNLIRFAGTRLAIKWEASSSSVSYKVYVTAGTKQIKPITTKQTLVTIPAKKGVTYKLRVVAINNSGISAEVGSGSFRF